MEPVIGKNLVLIGMMGTYKTSAGILAAEKLSMLFADSDAIFEFEYSMKIRECFENFGEEHFRKYESKVVVHLAECEGIVIATGGGSVLLEKNVDALRRNGLVINLTASANEIYERVSRDTSRPLLSGDVLAGIKRIMDEREEIYKRAAHYSLCTDGLSPDEVADKIVEIWRAEECS